MCPPNFPLHLLSRGICFLAVIPLGRCVADWIKRTVARRSFQIKELIQKTELSVTYGKDGAEEVMVIAALKRIVKPRSRRGRRERAGDKNQTDSFQRNRKFRHVPEGHALTRDTAPGQPIAAWTANELACLPRAGTLGVRPGRTPAAHRLRQARLRRCTKSSPLDRQRLQRCPPNPDLRYRCTRQRHPAL